MIDQVSHGEAQYDSPQRPLNPPPRSEPRVRRSRHLYPHAIGAMTVAGLAPAGVLFGFGVFLVSTGLFDGLPLPVQSVDTWEERSWQRVC